MSDNDDVIGFTFIGSLNDLIRPFDDSVVHTACLTEWERCDEFMLAWNKEAGPLLGRGHELTTGWHSRVRYKRDWFTGLVLMLGFLLSPYFLFRSAINRFRGHPE
ncbi:MAG: hypothetical protein LLG01_17770 [Planctomycetaceae bacterium]|nr:hypothetical protein [Planctomycetaceae bacterium]